MSLIAEVAIGLAGFAGGAGDALSIRMLLAAAFTALFAALVAVGAAGAGLAEAAAIQLGAATLLVGQVYWAVALARRIARLEPADRALFDLRLARLFRLILLSSLIAQLVAVSGLLAPIGPGLFLYGLLVCLGYAALGFVRLMYIRPASE